MGAGLNDGIRFLPTLEIAARGAVKIGSTTPQCYDAPRKWADNELMNPHTAQPILKEVWDRIRPDFSSWLVDLARYSFTFANLVFLFVVFKFLRAIGINADFIDTMEFCEHLCTGAVFVAFAFSTVRRAVGILFSRAEK